MKKIKPIILRDIEKPLENPLPDTLPAIIQNIFLNRGVIDAIELENELKYLYHPEKLSNIDKASDILVTAIQNNEKILIMGDYDADGATSSVLAVKALQRFGAQQVDFLVPNRFDYGYGLSPEIVELAYQEKKPDVIVTVDNGIVNHKGVTKAKSYGFKVIITDHHLPAENLPLPEADAIVNPNLQQDGFPSKNLAGVGVIFYVMSRLRAKLRTINWFEENNIPEPKMTEFLDLVALGTVADVVPLDHNNRILVTQGLKRIKQGACSFGILALIEVAKRQYHQITSSDLGFIIGPRLNAAGRLEDMSIGIRCLLSHNILQALPLAQRLQELNKERQQKQEDMLAEAKEKMAYISSQPMGFSICLYDETWHEGIVGLIASKLKDDYYRPSIIFAPSTETGMIKGSARSIPNLHIRDVLADINAMDESLITKFGGHAMAAGLSLPFDNLQKFTELFESTVKKRLKSSDLEPIILSDGELEDQNFSVEFAQLLQSMPWGQGFPEPLFHGTFFLDSQKIIADKHLKLWLQTAYGKSLEAIAFRHPELLDINTRKVQLAYRLSIQEYQGRQSIQLIIEQLDTIL